MLSQCRIRDEFRCQMNPLSSYRRSLILEQKVNATSTQEQLVYALEGAFAVAQDYLSDTNQNRETKLLFRNKPKMILWKAINTTVFILVAETDENHLMNWSFLHSFPRILDEHFKRPLLAQNWREVTSVIVRCFALFLMCVLPSLTFFDSQNSFCQNLRNFCSCSRSSYPMECRRFFLLPTQNF